MLFRKGDRIRVNEVFRKHMSKSKLIGRTGTVVRLPKNPSQVAVLMDGNKCETIWHVSFVEKIEDSSAQDNTKRNSEDSQQSG